MPFWMGGGFTAVDRLGVGMKMELSRGVRDQLAVLQRVHKKEVIGTGGYQVKSRKDVWTRRSGELSKSFHIDHQAPALEGYYGSDHIASRVLEEGTKHLPGGVIRARKKGGYLAIPLGRHGWRPKDFPDLFVITSRNGNKLLVESDGAGGVIPYFLLRKTVKLEPRPTMDMALERSESRRDAVMDKALTRAIFGVK